MSRWPRLFAVIAVILFVTGKLVAKGEWCFRCVEVVGHWCLAGHPESVSQVLDCDENAVDRGHFDHAGEGEF